MDYYLIHLIHAFLKYFNDNIDKMKPIVGIIEFMNGFGSSATIKKTTIVKYVNIAIKTFLVWLVSHALSNSTFLFRVSISLNLFLISSIIYFIKYLIYISLGL